ncbi:hypothetical protein ACJJTC_005328 [Scirpophaga incertulas]
MPLPTPLKPSSNAGRRKLENPAEEDDRGETSSAELTCLSYDRTSSSVRDYVESEGGGESPAPSHSELTSGVRVQILENILLAPPRTTMDYQTPAPTKERIQPRLVIMPTESPASPDDDEDVYRTPTRTPSQTPTREVANPLESARPGGSAREGASRDAHRESATVRAADASALRSRAVVADAPRGAVAPARSPVGSAAAVSAPRGSAGAAVASRDSTGTAASRDGSSKAGPSKPSERATPISQPKKPQTPHLAARRGTATTAPAATISKKTVAAKPTSTPPGVPHNTPSTPATAVPARTMPISRSQPEMQPPKPLPQRPRSRQSERSIKSDRSNDSTPERSGSRSSLGPPLSEPRALVSIPNPRYGPSAPTPFASSSSLAASETETPRTQKRPREEGDSDKAMPAARPRIQLSPAQQAADVTEMQPSTSYAGQVKSTRVAENKNEAEQTRDTAAPATRPKRRRGGKGRGGKAARTAKRVQQEKAATTTTVPAAPAVTRPTTKAPPQKPTVTEAQAPAATTTAATTSAATNNSETTLTHEPVVAALKQGTKAKPAPEGTANESVRDVLIGVLREVTLDLQRGADLTSIVLTLVGGLAKLITTWKT